MPRVRADLLLDGVSGSSEPGSFKELPHAPGVYFMKGKGRPEVIEHIQRCMDLCSTIPDKFVSRSDAAASADSVARSWPAAAFPGRNSSELTYVVTGSVIEAELLELDLIRHYRPEQRPEGAREAVYLHIDRTHPFPVFEISRRYPEGQSTGFGPFFDADKLRRGLEVARKILRLRYCSDVFPPPGHERCVRHLKEHCAAPCRGTITPAVYRSRLDRLVMFLRGEDDRLLEDLRRGYQAMPSDEVAAFDEGAHNLLDVQRTLLDMSAPANGAKLLVTMPGHPGARATIVLFRRGRIVDRFRTHPGRDRADSLTRRMQSALLTHRGDPIGLLRSEELAASQVVRRHLASPEPGERVYKVMNLSELPKLMELAIRDCQRVAAPVH